MNWHLPLFAFFAKLEFPELPRNSNGTPRLVFSDLMIVLAVCVTVCTALVVWAVLFRKPKDARESRGAAKSTPLQAADDLEEGARNRKKRRKKRRREHRLRNPTLAETGGLSSPRPEDDE